MDHVSFLSAIAGCRLGDENSKRAISEASLRFTLRIAEQWSSARFGRIIGDVVEEANAALWNSIDEFSGQRLEEFELFLAQYISQQLEKTYPP